MLRPVQGLQSRHGFDQLQPQGRAGVQREQAPTVLSVHPQGETRHSGCQVKALYLLRPTPALDFDMADKHCAILLICAKLKERQWRMKSADLIKPTRPDCQTKLAESIISNIFVLFPELHRAIASG